MTRFLTTAALAALVAAPAFAEVDKIKRVQVETDLGALENPAAAEYWGTIAEDLMTAISARVGDRADEDGAEILVDIREAELAGAFDGNLSASDAVLVGQVNVNDPNDNSNIDGYQLAVTLESAKYVAATPDGVIVLSATDNPEAYKMMVDAFADGVVERLK
jgi:hypothetical protein